jgi:hypothetical protein
MQYQKMRMGTERVEYPIAPNLAHQLNQRELMLNKKVNLYNKIEQRNRKYTQIKIQGETE